MSNDRRDQRQADRVTDMLHDAVRQLNGQASSEDLAQAQQASGYRYTEAQPLRKLDFTEGFLEGRRTCLCRCR